MKLKLKYREVRNLEYEIDLLDGYDWEKKSKREQHELIVRLKEGGIEEDEQPTEDYMDSELIDWDIKE